MSARNRVIVTLIAAMALWAPTSWAQTSTPEEPGDGGGTEAQEPSSQDRKQQRIEEYLRKREERRARKDLNRQHREARQLEADAAKIESQQLAAAAAAAEAVPLEEPMTEMTPAPPVKKQSKRRHTQQRASSLPRGLAQAQANVRLTELAHSQEALALICGLDRTFISLLERGQRQPTLSSIFAIADALEITPSIMLANVERLTH